MSNLSRRSMRYRRCHSTRGCHFQGRGSFLRKCSIIASLSDEHLAVLVHPRFQLCGTTKSEYVAAPYVAVLQTRASVRPRGCYRTFLSGHFSAQALVAMILQANGPPACQDATSTG